MHHLRMQWCRTINTLFHIFYDLFIFSFALITCVNYMRFEQLFSIIVYRKNNDRLNWNSVMHDESLYTRILNFIPESNRRFPNFYVVNFNKYYLYYAKWSSSRIMRHVRACAHDSLFFLSGDTFFSLFLYLHNDRFDENSDNSRESKPISKVAKLDFQVIAFGHLFSIAHLMLRNAIGYLADLFDMC